MQVENLKLKLSVIRKIWKKLFGNEDKDRNQNSYRSISHIVPTTVDVVHVGNRKGYIS